MVNGYVNIPNELTDLSSLMVPQVIPGIYKKMKDILLLNKPIVGKFSIDIMEAVFFPVSFELDGTIILLFVAGPHPVRLEIDKNDTVHVEAIVN